MTGTVAPMSLYPVTVSESAHAIVLVRAESPEEARATVESLVGTLEFDRTQTFTVGKAQEDLPILDSPKKKASTGTTQPG